MSERRSSELRFSVPWGHIAARAWGNEHNQPVLLLHGTMDNANSFVRLIQLLPGNYYYVAVDLPGHGLSSHFPSGVPLETLDYVIAVYYILEALKWQKCLCLGHSFGGLLAMLFHATFRDRFEKIVIIDTITGISFSPESQFQRWRELATIAVKNTKKEDILYTREQILNRFQNKRVFTLNRDAADALFERSTTRVEDRYKYNTDSRLKMFVMPLFNFEQYAEFFRQQSAPILFIVCSDSWYDYIKQRSTVDLIKRYFSGKISMVKVEGNHNVHNNNPEKVAPLVVEFFNDHKAKL